MKRCYVVDIDGTIADLSHRLPFIHNGKFKDWDQFFANVGKDLPHEHMRTMLYHLEMGQAAAMECHRAVFIYMSGRRESCRDDTLAWISTHAFPKPHRLYMRPEGDRRPDDIVKGELCDQMFADGYEPILVFDDRDRVVEMWRSRGIPCAQVARGNF